MKKLLRVLSVVHLLHGNFSTETRRSRRLHVEIQSFRQTQERATLRDLKSLFFSTCSEFFSLLVAGVVFQTFADKSSGALGTIGLLLSANTAAA